MLKKVEKKSDQNGSSKEPYTVIADQLMPTQIVQNKKMTAEERKKWELIQEKRKSSLVNYINNHKFKNLSVTKIEKGSTYYEICIRYASDVPFNFRSDIMRHFPDAEISSIDNTMDRIVLPFTVKQPWWKIRSDDFVIVLVVFAIFAVIVSLLTRTKHERYEF